ncbi:MAG: DUF1700 domain-containing protein [Clostridia bacterium]|nr:DUF1700 domain-containing protein [Clostridia bacterium]
MTKQEFTVRLRRGLSGLPRQEIEERVGFYGEMIDDRMEEGLSESAAVAAIGSADRIAAQILAEYPFVLQKDKSGRPKKCLRAWEILLLALGSPIWLSLLIAALVVALALVIVLWSLILSLWAVFVALVACAPCSVVMAVGSIIEGGGAVGLALLGAGIAVAGLSVLLFFAGKGATKASVRLCKGIASGIQNRFVGRGKEE